MRGGRRPALLLAGLLAIAGTWQLGSAGWLLAKAEFAQILVARAWQRTLHGEAEARPWSWADTWPVARLEAPSHGIDLYVLAGGSGRTLAFGPGHLDGTPLPGASGRSVIAAHRDSYFQFLQDLAPGEHLRVQTADGRWREYIALKGIVLDTRTEKLQLAETGEPELVLITCFPFDAPFAGSPLRYVLRAIPAERAEVSGDAG